MVLCLETWCKCNGMVLNTDKTKVLLVTTPHKRAKLSDNRLNLTFKSVQLKSSAGERLLGLHINENLKWDDHVDKVKKKISTNLWLLSRIKTYIPFNTRILYYKAYIQPHLDFCNIVWGGTKSTNLIKLCRLQKRACKTIFGQDYTSVPHAMEIMNSLNIHDRIILQKAKFMYKVSKGLVPGFITDMFKKRH